MTRARAQETALPATQTYLSERGHALRVALGGGGRRESRGRHGEHGGGGERKHGG